jgi:hypothetical protein
MMTAMFAEHAEWLCTSDDRHNFGRAIPRHRAGWVGRLGTDRRIPAQCPRVRAAGWSGGQDVPSYPVLLYRRVGLAGAREMLAKLSPRRYGHVLEPAPGCGEGGCATFEVSGTAPLSIVKAPGNTETQAGLASMAGIGTPAQGKSSDARGPISSTHHPHGIWHRPMRQAQ